jgi:hypothetical protein
VTVTELSTEASPESISLLLIGVSMVAYVLTQDIEGLGVLQHCTTSLSECQKLIELAIHDVCWYVMPSKSYLEISPLDHVVNWLHSEEMVPPCSSGPTKLLGGKKDFGRIRTISIKQWEFGFHHPEPNIRVEWIFCPSEQQRLSNEELLIGGRCQGTLVMITTIVLRPWLTLSELSQNLILQSHQLLHGRRLRRWWRNALILSMARSSCHLKFWMFLLSYYEIRDCT